MIMRIAGVVLAVSMLAPLLVSQEPTYEETTKWIVSKTSEEAGAKLLIPGNPPTTNDLEIATSYEEVSMDECKLKYAEVVFSSGMQIAGAEDSTEAPTVTKSAVSIPLAKVTVVKVNPPNKIVNSAFVVISTPTKLIARKETKKSGDKVLSQEEPVMEDKTSIVFHNEETANRIAKALNHAVSLCANSKEKEPF